MVAGGDSGIEQPIVRLGAAGFAPAQRAAIEACLARPTLGPRWQLASFREADGWWLNGAKAQVLPDGHLRVPAGLPTEHALHLDLAAVDRPIAFAEPLAATGLPARSTFRVDNEASMRAALREFDATLRLIAVQFALGAMVMRRGAALRQTVHHLRHGGVLLAVLDYRRGHVAIHPEAAPRELWLAEWLPKHEDDVDWPADYSVCTPGQLLWSYVRRTDRDLLPERYRTALIYFRHAPRVPLRWLRDSQLALLRELAAGPGHFANLQRRTGSIDAVLAEDLSCLYFTGAITTTPTKAAASRAGEESVGPATTGNGTDGAWLNLPVVHEDPSDVTVPARLLT
jgi:hypothetical protein